MLPVYPDKPPCLLYGFGYLLLWKDRFNEIFLASLYGLRYNIMSFGTLESFSQNPYAGVAELADALDLGSSGYPRAGSSPVACTRIYPS